jgi:uncharacterized protein
MSTQPHRVLPPSGGPSAFFWQSAAEGALRILCCSSCRYLIHPPASYCPRCSGRECMPRRVSARGTVYSFTINQQPWDGTTDPYVIAVADHSSKTAPGSLWMAKYR